jgi:hypothetical protein
LAKKYRHICGIDRTSRFVLSLSICRFFVWVWRDSRYYSVLSEARFTLVMATSRVAAVAALPTWVDAGDVRNAGDDDNNNAAAAVRAGSAACSTCFAGTRYLTDQETIRATFLDAKEQDALMQGALFR